MAYCCTLLAAKLCSVVNIFLFLIGFIYMLQCGTFTYLTAYADASAVVIVILILMVYV